MTLPPGFDPRKLSGLAAVPVAPRPTQDQIDEQRHVQEMQVRTQAVALAVQALKEDAVESEELIGLATRIAAFIAEG